MTPAARLAAAEAEVARLRTILDASTTVDNAASERLGKLAMLPELSRNDLLEQENLHRKRSRLASDAQKAREDLGVAEAERKAAQQVVDGVLEIEEVDLMAIAPGIPATLRAETPGVRMRVEPGLGVQVATKGAPLLALGPDHAVLEARIRRNRPDARADRTPGATTALNLGSAGGTVVVSLLAPEEAANRGPNLPPGFVVADRLRLTPGGVAFSVGGRPYLVVLDHLAYAQLLDVEGKTPNHVLIPFARLRSVTLSGDEGP